MNLLKRLLGKPSSKISHPLEKHLGYSFSNRALLKQAFTHRSITTEPKQNYERLEFLGDAVIDIIISQELMKDFKNEDEGFLTQKRSSLVQKSFLGSMGKKLNLLSHLNIESTVDLNLEKIAEKQAANTYEALVGAIFLDGGLKPARKLILNTLWVNRQEAWKAINYKGQLIELCHILKIGNPRFLVTNVSGPDHQKLFEVYVIIKDDQFPTGIGTNKKTAEQSAAQYALEALSS
ncbi:MAG: ribonuclease III [Candidatus Marinimicrobia bacterium]|nr:ribonuclease III [Candidatus Neomarinimicrobiota bacterium]MBT3618619.1 ribonuclease III [Candidatus Neomarinimicrobiota bacterium]MBT3829651.1 ribonuclease III [Candidatus Neomarinimicrobiota bacterium]MBT3997368.1 ribonuclease III [Candidatus Neomarinimicrobiota bacterium]MBT4281057.1 ribonuclease III [Candidatus Neomarinimicrobiota bacterium]